ncbi:hypothetical protein MUB24_05285 [Lederbergia sp. NSJ-179]|uniref:hypothetical protein n=1 Tax=Lederbergia sp. NSJ-179 TaxID=2931402 RepID=UPI001FD58F92|nr:hypothetical protein [Lederbergia sp. NSJ-179]MCJ7840337.1 hypothetical protein [Lederbergia sp. NSJ-179]
MGYIGPIHPDQYQEYHKRISSKLKHHDPIPIPDIEKVQWQSSFQRILSEKRSDANPLMKRKKTKKKRRFGKADPFVFMGMEEKGRHFNEYI